jgi:hypothetical protein
MLRLKILTCLSLITSLFATLAHGTETVASVRAIEVPYSLTFAGLNHSTDGYGSEILTQGLDALFVIQDDGYAVHYSAQKDAFTNFFEETSDPAAPTQRFRYHYAPDAIYRISGNSFDRIDRESGIVTSRDNPFGSPVMVIGLGDVLVALHPTGLTGYRLSTEETIYEVAVDTGSSNERFLTMERDGDRIYALKRSRNGTFFSTDVSATWLECYDLRTGTRLYRQPVELAFLSDNTYEYRSIIPFDVGFGVVAIGSVDEISLYNAEDGSLRGTVVNPTLRWVGSNGWVDSTYYMSARRDGTSHDFYSGNLLVGNNRLYVQNDNASGSTSDAPGVSVFDFDFNHLYDIPNGYRSIGVTDANGFGSEMAKVGDRLLIGSRRFYRAASEGYRIDVADPLVFEVSFTAPDGTFPDPVEALYAEEAYLVSENAKLAVQIELSAGTEEEVSLTLRPDFLTSFEADNPATAVDDFPTAGQTVIFAPGETSKTLFFPIVDDVAVEEPEEFQLILTRNTANVSISDPFRRVTIMSDDFDPTGDLVRIGRLNVGDREPGEAISEIAASDELVAVGLPGTEKVLLYNPFTRDYLGEVSSSGGATDSFGLSLDVFGDTVAIGEPQADGGVGELIVSRVDQSGASPAVTVLDRIQPPNVGLGVEDFGRRVRIHGTKIAVAGEVQTSATDSEVCVFIYEQTPGGISLADTVVNPEPATPGNSLEEDRFFANAFDLNADYLVISNPLTRFREVTLSGNTSLIAEEGSAYIYELSNLALAPVDVVGDAGFGAEGLALGATDFVIVDSDEPIIGSGYDGRNVLYRYDFSGNQLHREDRTDPSAHSQSLADLVYNGAVAMRSNDQTRQVQATFSGDNSQATYQFGEPFRRPGISFPALLSSVSRAGFSRSSSVAYIAPIFPSGPVPLTSDALNCAINSDHFFTIDRGETDFPAVFQLPNPIAVRVLPGSMNEGATLAASEGQVSFELNAVAPTDVRLRFSTLSETAKVDDGGIGADVLTQSGEVTIPAGQTTATATIALAVDEKFEGDETFQVIIDSALNATIQDRVATITIIDDESELDLPVVSIADASFTESDIFTGQLSNGQLLVNDAELTLSLSAASDEDVIVYFEVSSNDASFANELRQTGFEQIDDPGPFPPDYTVPRYGRDLNGDFASDRQRPGFAYKALIPAGETTATIEIPIGNDDIFENSEQIQVELIEAVQARLAANPIGLLTLLDDDSSAPSSLSFAAPGSSVIVPHTLAASDHFLAVGAYRDRITVNDFDGNNPTVLSPPRGNSNISFGEVVAVGEGYVIGADWQTGFPSSHWVYLFDTAGNLIGELNPDTPFGNFFGPDFGSGAAIAASGGTTGLIVGAGGSKQVFIFDASDRSELRVLSTSDSGFGKRVSAGANVVLASTFGNGAYLYDWTTGSQLHHFDATGFDGALFGETVYLSGNYAILGSDDGSVAGAGNSDGVIAVYNRSTYQHLYTLTPDSGDSGFGEAAVVAGGVLAVGSEAGVHLFQLSDGTHIDSLAMSWNSLAGNSQYLFILDDSSDEVVRYEAGELLAAGQTDFAKFLTANPTITINGKEVLEKLSLPPLIAYALGLDGDDRATASDRKLQLNPAFGGPKLRLKTPGRLPPDVRLEIFESTTLGGTWECIGVKTGDEPWYLMRRGGVLPAGGDQMEQVELDLDPANAPRAFYYLEASQL